MLIVLGASGCMDTNTSTDRVKLRVDVTISRLGLTESVLVTELSGEARLLLSRGDYADGPSVVAESPSIVVVSAETGTEVMSVDVSPDLPLPWTITPGSTLSVVMNLSERSPVSRDQIDALCAGEVALEGSLRDAEEPFAFGGGAAVVQGCP
jgi:hypothetical protein